ncbi:protein abrupt [Anabrus simplex]|uniref:protein abrupt n=1 Tax=Anabrus simplex TaxID=316456 RepID=UPI0035A348B2
MVESQEFCLRWSSYQQQLGEALRSLLERELLVDVTLACDGRSLRAHRTILSACSNYFQDLFQESSHPHPIVILKDVRFEELEALIRFMYHGEVTMDNESLPGFLRTAETLQIRGLTGGAVPCQDTVGPSSKNKNETSRPVISLREDSNSGDNRHEVLGPANDPEREGSPEIKRIKVEHRSPQKSSHVALSVDQYSGESNISGIEVRDSDAVADHDNNRCHLKTDELPVSTEGFATSDREIAHKTIASLDGLSQLVLPVLQEESGSSSQYIMNQGSNLCPSVLTSPQQNSSNHSMMTRPFRHRVLWNHDQLLQLESWYRADRYPTGQAMRQYADTLAAMCPSGASPTRQNVDYWFQNRRRKDSHPEVMQQREKKKMAKTLWGQILDQRGQSGS